MENYIKVIIAVIILIGLYFIFNSKTVIGQGFEGFEGHMDDDYNVQPNSPNNTDPQTE